jgi:hypothetical protein
MSEPTPTRPRRADQGWTNRQLAACVAAVALVAGGIVWIAASPSEGLTPSCTDTSTACQQRRLTALEQAVTALQSPSAAPSASPSAPGPSTTAPPSPTPTATTPSPTPTATTPSACAWPTCFPTTANTGPTGTLTPSAGDRTISTGTLANTAVNGVIRVTGGTTAAPVVIRNSSARGVVGCGGCVYSVEDSLLDGNGTVPSGAQAVVQGGSFTLLRTEVTNGPDLVRFDGSNKPAVVRDSLLRNLAICSTCHADSTQYFDGGSNATVLIDHSSIDARSSTGQKGNSAAFLADDPVGLKATLTHSLWAGGGYTVRLHDARSLSGTVYRMTDNTILSGSFDYGPCLLTNSVPYDGVSGFTWTGNLYSTGSPLPATEC